jgi:molecular chaperone HscB
MTHFEIFGLPASVDLDVKALEQSLRTKLLEVHPDRLATADAATRRKAADLSASLNEAVKVLRDPVRRAFYVLKLKGVDLESEQAAAKLALPVEFLEEIMERREALEAVKGSRDLSRAQAMEAEVRTAQSQVLERGLAALRADDVAAASSALGRVRYYTRFLEEVDAFGEELLS